MNAQYLGDWDVAPRATRTTAGSTCSTAIRRWGSAGRPAAASPPAPTCRIPRIDERRVSAVQIEFARPTPVELDGEPLGQAPTLSIRVEPDALLCVV